MSDEGKPPSLRGAGHADFTVRALSVGCLIGALLGAANVYMGLKAGLTDSGNITATLLAYAVLGRRRSGRALSVGEHNIAQSVAVMAGAMAVTGALVNAAPALQLAHRPLSPWGLLGWGVAVSTLGTVVAFSLRRRLLVETPLPFPTGAATAELIGGLHRTKGGFAARLRALAAASGISAAYVWFRDGRPAVLPAQLGVPGVIGGVDASALGLGLACQPMLLGVGALIGVRAGLSILAGALVAWGVIAPQLVERQWVSGAGFPQLVGWLVWPGAGLILGASLVSLGEQHRSFLKGFRDLVGVWRRGTPATEGSEGVPTRVMGLLFGASALLVVGLGYVLFDAAPVVMLVALALSLMLAGLCVRAAGQTDLAPSGAVGQVSQVVLAAAAPGHLSSNLGGASVTVGVATQASNSLWCLKTGEVLGLSVKPQLYAQLIAGWVGAVVCVAVYSVLMKTGGLGTAALPAPAAMMSKALADALTIRGEGLPPHSLAAAGVGVAVGAVLHMAARWRYAPVPLAVGVAFVAPASFAATIALGGLVAWGAARRWPQAAEELSVPVASGAIAGEAVLGVFIAALAVSGVL